MTEAQCRACVMTGGCEVQTEEEAKAYSEMVHIMRTVAVGDHLKEPPCLPADLLEMKYRKERGRECPREELDPLNEPAYTLLSIQMNPKTRPLGSRFVRSLLLSPEEEELLVRRVAYVLMDPAMNPSLPSDEDLLEGLEG